MAFKLGYQIKQEEPFKILLWEASSESTTDMYFLSKISKLV